jgi:hypothetical protein
MASGHPGHSPPLRRTPPKHKSPQKKVTVKVDRSGKATIGVKTKKPKGATFVFPDSKEKAKKTKKTKKRKTK